MFVEMNSTLIFCRSWLSSESLSGVAEDLEERSTPELLRETELSLFEGVIEVEEGEGETEELVGDPVKYITDGYEHDFSLTTVNKKLTLLWTHWNSCSSHVLWCPRNRV